MSKSFGPEEDTAIQPAVIANDALQETKRLLQKRDIHSQAIVIDDSGGLRNSPKHFS